MSGGPLQRARLALMQNQPAVAEEICRRRLEKRPDEIMTRLMLAQALIQQQRGKEAIDHLRRILEAQPKNVDALLLLSSALVSSNQINPPKEALTAAERAVQLQPGVARTHVQLAEALMSKREFDRARGEADEAVKLEPRLPAAQLIKGMALVELKDFDNAILAFRNALRHDQTMAVAYFGLARALAELKKPDEAMRAVDDAQRLNPNLPPAQIAQLRASIYQKQRHYGQAYGEYLALQRRSGSNNALAPIGAGFLFVSGIFGQAGPFVILAILIVILVGIGFIPVVGGVLIDILLVLLVGFGAWNALRTFTGTPTRQLLREPVRLAAAIGGLVVGAAVIFGLVALIVGRGHHPGGLFWLTPLSFGLAAVVGLVLAAVAARFAGSVGTAVAKR